MSKRVYVCSECGKRGRWSKEWRHLVEACGIWCSPACGDRAYARWKRRDYGPAPFEIEAMTAVRADG
jgi:hypothetical protein